MSGRKEPVHAALHQGTGIAPSITRPADVLPVVADARDRRKEYLVAVFVNVRNQVICGEDLSVCSLNASLV